MMGWIKNVSYTTDHRPKKSHGLGLVIIEVIWAKASNISMKISRRKFFKVDGLEDS